MHISTHFDAVLSQYDEYWRDVKKLAKEATCGRNFVWHLTETTISSRTYSKIRFVTPKTNGERGFLICNRYSGKCNVQMDNGVVFDLPTSLIDADLYGFVLDVEVIKQQGSTPLYLIIAFDVLIVDPRNVLVKDKSLRFYKGELMSAVPNRTDERYSLLCSIVENVNAKVLITKPMLPATEAVKLWGTKDKLPYPVNGLAFLMERKYKDSTAISHVFYKWKPVNELSIHVALFPEPGGNRFIPHVGPENFSFSYFPLYRFPTPGNFEFTIRRELACSERAGIMIPTKTIQYQRDDERNCVITSRYGRHNRPCTSEELHHPNQYVEISSDDACWARYQIADVRLDIHAGTLQFCRIRRDKRSPDDIDKIDTAIQLSVQPLELTYIVAKLNETGAFGNRSDEELELCPTSWDEFMQCHDNFLRDKQSQQQAEELIPGIIKVLDEEILSYLLMEDQVPARRVSKHWRMSIDSLERNFSKENFIWMEKNNHCYGQTFLNDLTLPSIGCFLRFGGKLKV